MFTPVGIELPEYSEWVRGTAYPKLNPSPPHGRLQIVLGSLLYAWGHARGHVAAENDMNVRVSAGDIRRYLPDIHFTSYAALDAGGDADSPIQSVAPDLVIEIRSPGQSVVYLDDKVAAFLAAGTQIVLVVNPQESTIDVHRSTGRTTLDRGASFRDPAFPGFTIDISALFDSLGRR